MNLNWFKLKVLKLAKIESSVESLSEGVPLPEAISDELADEVPNGEERFAIYNSLMLSSYLSCS